MKCIETIQNVAQTTGLEFTNESLTDFYQNLVRTYQDKTLIITLEPNKVYLEADNMATAICSTPPPTQGYQPDQLTSTLQLKFYNNLAEVLSRILEAYYISTTNLQHMYMLAIDTKLPTAGGFKTTADLCKAIKAQMPMNVPSYSFTQPSSFQIFLETNLENSLLATNAYTQLSKLVQALCLKEENKPQLANINHALVAMNINIQTHIMAVHKHMMSTTMLQFPKAFAILIYYTGALLWLVPLLVAALSSQIFSNSSFFSSAELELVPVPDKDVPGTQVVVRTWGTTVVVGTTTGASVVVVVVTTGTMLRAIGVVFSNVVVPSFGEGVHAGDVHDPIKLVLTGVQGVVPRGGATLEVPVSCMSRYSPEVRGEAVVEVFSCISV